MTECLVRTGLLVVERTDYTERGRYARAPFPAITERDVLERYKGIDGQLWPDRDGATRIELERGLASLDQRDRVRTYYRSLQPKSRCDMLAVGRSPSAPGQLGLELLGYDIGFVESEDNVYSFLFHEVVHPRFDELRAFVPLLNTHLLFESMQAAKEMLAVQGSLEGEGATFETTDSPETCEPFAIFAVEP